jgi:hypothetical protein
MQAERIEELSFDAAIANQAREIGNYFGLTYMQVWSDTSIASQVIDKMKEQQATIAQQADRIKELESLVVMGFWEEEHPEFKQGYDYHEMVEPLTAEQANGFIKLIKTQAEQLAAAQARIDELMLEYDPEAMTPEQLANYAAHQRSATPEEQAAIDAAIAASKEPK